MSILPLLLWSATAAVLIYVSITDIRRHIIPNRIMGPALAVALIVALARPERWELLLGGLIGGGMFLLPMLIFGPERAGGGDFKLALFIGLVLGFPAIGTALGLAFVSGGCVIAVGMLRHRLNRRRVIPFGPHLAFGGILAGLIMALPL